MAEDAGSISRLLVELKAGDPLAAQPIWERYCDRLVRLARQRLARGRRGAAVEDEEDAALSAFDSFCHGAARGRFPQLNDRDDLWKLLVVITARKAFAQIERRKARKRGGDLGPSVDAEGDPVSPEELVGREPTPEFAAMVAEECERLLRALDDDGLRQVALWRMEGYTGDEIADRLGLARRTVARRLDLIRQIWQADVPT